ncbi:MMPL family transporter [Paractinoplanes brasiliensis]|uniref:RND superfamily putative drug exporter n=1 Tax=Paractinoplanes brasiliensis TaxID=52695 RepID=A0A4R6JL98_9ACTN|nr:efflux RND transporter permease subunit [Actinoplanes brasiliensis]TDO36482.1 RND superfamily putative drug exporter [Actinoplanes brasiliensis]GID32537.1 putative membrane protein [Actinoplanes brasiliensis]
MLAGLGRAMYVRRFVVIAVWVVVAVAGAVFGGGVYDRTESMGTLPADAPAAVAQHRLDELAPEGERLVAVISGREVGAIALINSVTRIAYEIRALPGVAEVDDSYTTGNRRISTDQRASLITVELRPGLSDDEASRVAEQVSAALRRIDAPEILIGGELPAERDFADQAVRDAAVGESVALVCVALLLIVLLGGVLAGLLPLAAAVGAVTATLLALIGLASLLPVSDYTVNVVTLLGIGLAVDYSLLMIARFREERAADPRVAVPELLARTVGSAGRAVLVSGSAVAAALVGLFAFGGPLLSAMALGGALVVVLATVAGLTLVPALIAIAHRRIPARGRWRQRGPGLLARLAGFAQRRPGAVALTVTAGLLVLSAPLFFVQFGNSDVRVLPSSSEARQTHDAVRERFADPPKQPLTVVVEAAPDRPDVQRLFDIVEQLPGVSDVYPRSGLPPGVSAADVVPAGAEDGPQAQKLVADLRALDTPAPLLVAGPAAELADAKRSVAARLPVALAIIVVATGALLFALTRSVVVPVKAIAMNLLTLLATMGVLVAVFQWGWGAGVLGFEPWGALDLTTPLLLFVFGFGLSMDYEVFLLARIKQEWDRRTGDDAAANDRAVLAGITAAGPVVTTAALAIGIVFLGFVLGELVAVKEIGVGMAVAVLLDVTVVRGLLLPATMSLLGRWNWWRPGARTEAPPPLVPAG